MNSVHPYPDITGKVLKALRLRSDYSQTSLGKVLGKSRSTLSRIERGKRELTPLELSQYLKAVHATQAEFDKMISPLVLLKELSEHAVFEESLESVPEGAGPVQKRKEIISILRDYFKEVPVKEVFLFGSIARNTYTDSSDIDLYLEFEQDAKVSLFDLSRMKLEISEKTGRNIDLVLKGSEYSFITQSLEAEKVSVYG